MTPTSLDSEAPPIFWNTSICLLQKVYSSPCNSQISVSRWQTLFNRFTWLCRHPACMVRWNQELCPRMFLVPAGFHLVSARGHGQISNSSCGRDFLGWKGPAWVFSHYSLSPERQDGIIDAYYRVHCLTAQWPNPPHRLPAAWSQAYELTS